MLYIFNIEKVIQMTFPIRRAIHSFIYRTKFWPLIILLWIITIFIGYVGFQQSIASQGFFDGVYCAIRLALGGYSDNPIEESPLLNFARFFALLLSFATFLVIIETFFYERTRLWWRSFWGGHTIICGMGSVGRRYIKSYLDDDDDTFIVIESNPSNPKIKEYQEKGVHILIGDATDRDILVKAGIRKAKSLIVVTGSDTKNAIIATNCKKMREGNPQNFICSVHISNPLLCNLLQAKWYRDRLKEPSDEKTRKENEPVILEPFNIYQLGGMLILEEYPPFSSTKDTLEKTNILVIGGGKFGESIIQRLPHIWQITPGVRPGMRYTVTLLDRKATELKKSFLELYPVIKDYCDIIPLDIEVGSADFLSLKFLFNDKKEFPFSIIYVCFYNFEDGLYSALEMDEFLQRGNSKKKPKIIVRSLYKGGINDLVEEINEPEKIQNLNIFPLIDTVCTSEFTENGMLTEVLAHATHENYIITCLDNGDISPAMKEMMDPPTEQKANTSMVPWRELSKDIKIDNREQVKFHSKILEHFGYAIRYKSRWEPETPVIISKNHIELMAACEHARWERNKKARGVTEHPCFGPYEGLKESDKKKDSDIFINLNRLLARVNMKVVKKEDLP
jgi:hypothetical protein